MFPAARFRFIFTVVTVVLAFSATAAIAGPRDARRTERVQRFSVTGTIVAVDDATHTIVVAVKGANPRALRGTEAEVTVAENARIRRDGKATFENLEVGDKVSARGTRAADGTLTARRVNASVPEPVVEESPTPSTDTTTPSTDTTV